MIQKYDAIASSSSLESALSGPFNHTWKHTWKQLSERLETLVNQELERSQNTDGT